MSWIFHITLLNLDFRYLISDISQHSQEIQGTGHRKRDINQITNSTGSAGNEQYCVVYLTLMLCGTNTIPLCSCHCHCYHQSKHWEELTTVWWSIRKLRKKTALTQKGDDYTALFTWNYLILAQGAQLKLEPTHRTQKLAHSRTAAQRPIMLSVVLYSVLSVPL
jgi:hypothetical protein